MSLLFKSLQKNTSRPHTITRTVFFFNIIIKYGLHKNTLYISGSTFLIKTYN